MRKVFLLHVTYRNAVNLHRITSAVESVEGVRIQRLNLVNRGRDFVGTIAVEAARLIDFDNVLRRVKRRRGISKAERVMDVAYCCG